MVDRTKDIICAYDSSCSDSSSSCSDSSSSCSSSSSSEVCGPCGYYGTYGNHGVSKAKSKCKSKSRSKSRCGTNKPCTERCTCSYYRTCTIKKKTFCRKCQNFHKSCHTSCYGKIKCAQKKNCRTKCGSGSYVKTKSKSHGHKRKHRHHRRKKVCEPSCCKPCCRPVQVCAPCIPQIRSYNSCNPAIIPVPYTTCPTLCATYSVKCQKPCNPCNSYSPCEHIKVRPQVCTRCMNPSKCVCSTNTYY